MRNFQRHLPTIIFLVLLSVGWLWVGAAGVDVAIKQYHAGYVVGAIANIVVLLLVTAWLVFDVIFPIIKQIRSDK